MIICRSKVREVRRETGGKFPVAMSATLIRFMAERAFLFNCKAMRSTIIQRSLVNCYSIIVGFF